MPNATTVDHKYPASPERGTRRFGAVWHGLSWVLLHRSQPGRIYEYGTNTRRRLDLKGRPTIFLPSTTISSGTATWSAIRISRR
jgi:hypothetical protein